MRLNDLIVKFAEGVMKDSHGNSLLPKVIKSIMEIHARSPNQHQWLKTPSQSLQLILFPSPCSNM